MDTPGGVGVDPPYRLASRQKFRYQRWVLAVKGPLSLSHSHSLFNPCITCITSDKSCARHLPCWWPIYQFIHLILPHQKRDWEPNLRQRHLHPYDAWLNWIESTVSACIIYINISLGVFLPLLYCTYIQTKWCCIELSAISLPLPPLFAGGIPPWIARLQLLEVLDLSATQLGGGCNTVHTAYSIVFVDFRGLE